MKSVSEKKGRGHRTSRIGKSEQSYTMAICTIIVYFSTWRARSMYDVTCEFACAVRMHRNNWRERP